MKSHISIATLITFILMISYAVALAIGGGGNYENDKFISILLPDIQIPVNFTISSWWNLLLFPVSLYCLSFTFKINAENEGNTLNAMRVVLLTMVNVIIASMTILFIILEAVIPASIFNPLTIISSVGVISLAIYTVFGMWFGFGIIMFRKARVMFNEQNTLNYFISTLDELHRQGIIQSLPIIIGLTIGFIFRYVAEQTVIVVKKVKLPKIAIA